MDNNIVRQFENHQIRSAWNAEEEKWYFSIVDVVGALSESANPTDYLKKMRKRDEELAAYLGTNCPQVPMKTSTGKLRKTLAGTPEHVLRVIQSIPSKKAEPFKRWLAKVGAERIQETIDPEAAIQRGMEYYAKKGYPEGWIRQRLMSIEMRKELTSEWQRCGVSKGGEFAILTDEISRAWSVAARRRNASAIQRKTASRRSSRQFGEVPKPTRHPAARRSCRALSGER